MILKLKSILYRYTGIYLAETEENIYLQSKKFWKDWSKVINSKKNNIKPINVQELLIGLWQSDRGFVRPMSRFWFKRPRFFWSLIDWFATLFIVVKLDIRRLVRKNK